MLRLSGRRVPFCCGKNRVRRAAAVQTVQNRLPRACGEKPVLSTMLRAASGSSPRMRGEATSIIAICIMERITPACAGRSRHLRPLALGSGHHPRVRGEKLVALQASLACFGSPPRVRGEVHIRTFVLAVVGITPACAGRSRRRQRPPMPARDHPRVCGEKYRYSYINKPVKGSPPRVRGEGARCDEIGDHAGITPACAGRSLLALSAISISADHPRVCGEK